MKENRTTSNPLRIGAVITAAGMSTRMGDFKQLMQIGGLSMAERVVINFQRAGVRDIVMVTGYRAEEVEKALSRRGVTFLRNADYALEVQKIRDAGAEVVFAIPHWGEEYRREPEASTVLLAKKLIAAGVDVILGGHPHMVQPIEFLEEETEEGKTRTGLAAYSLGNFISNQSDRYTDSGIILDFTICRLQKDNISVENVRVIPTYCWRRDDMIQPLCSKKYLNRAPEGMDQNTWLRLKESYEELRELIDEKIPMIAH